MKWRYRSTFTTAGGAAGSGGRETRSPTGALGARVIVGTDHPRDGASLQKNFQRTADSAKEKVAAISWGAIG